MGKFLFGLLAFSGLGWTQECTYMWTGDLHTDPLHTKHYSGDTTAAYGVLSYRADANLAWEFRGEFPRARFFSLESQATKIFLTEDSIFDYQLVPDSDSTNPFMAGNPMDAEKRSFTIRATPDKAEGDFNTLRLPTKGLSHSVMLRIYTPADGVTITKQDFPRVFALDRRTGKERSCPRPASYADTFHFPQFLADLYAKAKPEFVFFHPPKTAAAGMNSAARYMIGVQKVNRDEVALLRFQAPSYFDASSGKGLFSTDSQVRYWSMCVVNLPKNMTLVCLPDYRSFVQDDGYQYIVVGNGPGLAQRARELGYSHLPDTREPNQRVYQFVYRNLVGQPEFSNLKQFQGDFVPEGMKCSRRAFLAGRCGW